MQNNQTLDAGMPAPSSGKGNSEVEAWQVITELPLEARLKQEIIQSLLEPCDLITYGQRQREAAEKLGVSVQKVRRLVKKLEEKGLEALTQAVVMGVEGDQLAQMLAPAGVGMKLKPVSAKRI